MDEPKGYYEVNQTQKDNTHMIFMYMWSLKNKTRNKKATTKERNTLINIEKKLVVTKGEEGGGMCKMGGRD